MMNKNVLRFTKLLARWLWRGRYHLLSFVTFTITLLYMIRSVTFCQKTVAILMVLIGLAIILVQQILDANKFSEHQPNTLTNWLKSFPTGKAVTLSLEGNIGITCSVKGHLTVSIPPDTPIEGKVEFLLRQFGALDAAIAKIDDRVDGIGSAIANTEKKLQGSIDALNTSINKIVAGHVIGTYDLNLLGINMTICGTLIQFFAE